MSRPIDPPKFVQATTEDLKPNGTVYICGRKATITNLDFPLVYYTFDAELRERHRSFSAAPELFQVVSRSQAFDESNAAGSRGKQGRKAKVVRRPVDSDSEEEDDSQPRAEAAAATTASSAVAAAASSSSSGGSGGVAAGAGASFLAAFGRRYGAVHT